MAHLFIDYDDEGDEIISSYYVTKDITIHTIECYELYSLTRVYDSPKDIKRRKRVHDLLVGLETFFDECVEKNKEYFDGDTINLCGVLWSILHRISWANSPKVARFLLKYFDYNIEEKILSLKSRIQELEKA